MAHHKEYFISYLDESVKINAYWVKVAYRITKLVRAKGHFS